ncbi:class I adenylate-forming enzyme family protein [Halodesulfurarchaeum sp.]|uniref:class I adenylate-forming enzyme family protein n=1 Tax=Halodesulfurarchaeum sp. TaxID=1980530 RepID=UPI001BBA249C|nr:acyl--CoA ligase [Halodesulfurarchaeum sp.]
MDEYLRQAARERPDHPALIDAKSGRTWSYAKLNDWADRIASELTDHDTKPGDRIGLIMSRSPDAIATVWGVFRANGTLVPLDPGEPAAEIRSRCKRADTHLCLTSPETSIFDVETDELPVPTVDTTTLATDSTTDRTEPAQPSRSGNSRAIDETRVILFTSGTTGTPTGVRLTGRNLGASAASTVQRLEANPTDRWLLDLPLYHAGGLSIPIRTAMLGATTVLRRSFDATETAQAMDEYDITGASLVPTMLERLLEEPGVPKSLRFVLVGGAATAPALTKRALENDIPLYTSYGMTETASGIATATPAELQTRPGTVGRPVQAATVSIQDDTDKTVPPGEIGEITVSGPIVSPGGVDGTERDPDDHLRTGDRGFLTERGLLVVTGRIDDLIVTGGENVSPREVAAAIRGTHPVSAVSVLGLPDDEWGERVAAAVVVDETEASSERMAKTIRERLRGQLADYKLPKTVSILDSLPRTASGTVDRAALRERLLTEET